MSERQGYDRKTSASRRDRRCAWSARSWCRRGGDAQAMQEANVELDRKRNILEAAGMLDDPAPTSTSSSAFDRPRWSTCAPAFHRRGRRRRTSIHRAPPPGSRLSASHPADADIANIGRREKATSPWSTWSATAVRSSTRSSCRSTAPACGSTMYGFLALESRRQDRRRPRLLRAQGNAGAGRRGRQPALEGLWPGKQASFARRRRWRSR